MRVALEDAGVTPDNGDVLVTGAAGGVGSVAIALLDKLGYRVVASSRRADQERDYLLGIGAQEIIDAKVLSGTGVALDKERWAGAVTHSGAAPWPIYFRRPNITAPSPPVAWRRGRTCLPPSCRSSYAT